MRHLVAPGAEVSRDMSLHGVHRLLEMRFCTRSRLFDDDEHAMLEEQGPAPR